MEHDLQVIKGTEGQLFAIMHNSHLVRYATYPIELGTSTAPREYMAIVLGQHAEKMFGSGK